mgnify:CR=1 FL=1
MIINQKFKKNRVVLTPLSVIFRHPLSCNTCNNLCAKRFETAKRFGLQTIKVVVDLIIPGMAQTSFSTQHSMK